MPHNKITVDVHGSCVSRDIFNVEKDILDVNHNISRNNIASCMMPPADIPIRQEELQFSSDYAYRCVRYAMEKSTVPLLLKSDSDFLIIDFYDFCQHVAAYENTTFSTYDYTVLRTPSLGPYMKNISQVNFLELPCYLWYGYVDLYFEKVKERFKDKIVLVRLCCCDKYISKSKAVLPTPERLLCFGNAMYNQALRELEDYVIARHNPYVIDVTKYFIGDEAYNPDVTPVHLEANYHTAAWNIMKYIIQNSPERKYYDYLPANVVADLLLKPVSTEDFYKMWKDMAKPFTSCEFIDEICGKFPEDALIQNRSWLGKLYNLYGSSPIDNPPELEAQKISAFMKALIDLPEESAFSDAFTQLLIQKHRLR